MSVTAKSFAKGSNSPPSRQPGVLRLYSTRFCPYAKRARLALAAKKIPYEVVNLNLDEKPEWYARVSSNGKVPLLEGDGLLLTESLIIVEYLDAAYPGYQLTPADPYQRAKDRMVLEITFSKVTANTNKAYKTPENAKEAFSDGQANFAELEKELKDRNSTFFGGDKPSMLDLMMWPWFEVFTVCHHLLGEEFKLASILPNEKFPLLNRWIKELVKFPAVQELHNPKELGLFLESAKTGKRNFDVGL